MALYPPWGTLQVVEILLDAGADLEHLDDISGTPLHGAARRNHFGCCRLLLNRGARVDAADGLGNRPLHLAAAEGAVSALEVRLWRIHGIIHNQ